MALGRAFIAGLLVVASSTCAPTRFEDATLALLDVRVVTLQGDTVLEDRMVVISGDRILAVERSDPRRLAPHTLRVETGGAYVLPGLVDAHVHALHDATDALERALPLFVANGVTTVRDMGSELPILTEVRARLDSEPGRVAPRLFAAGPLLDGTRKPWYGKLPLILESPDQVREQLPRLRQAGVDFFKVYEDLDPDTYDAIAAEARASGVPFAGHVPAGVPLARAVEAGQRTVEHFGFSTVKDCVAEPDEWFRRAIDAKFRQGYDAYFRLMIEHWESVDWTRCTPVLEALGRSAVYFTPTLDMELNDRGRIDEDAVRYMPSRSRGWCNQVLDGIAAADPELRERAYRRHIEAFERIRDSGTRLLAGTDTPNNCVVEGFSLHGELALLVEAGLSPLDALRSASVEAANALAVEDTAGRVAAGMNADLVLMQRNPLKDIGNTRSIAGVVLRGRWLDRPALDALLADALRAAETGGPDTTEPGS